MNRLRACFCSLAIVLLCAAPAVASYIPGSGPLANEADSYQGKWHGSTNFVGDPPSKGLAGTIEWAVYAPGHLPVGFAGLDGYSVTPGEYLYAYQAYITGTAGLSSLSVVIDHNLADNIGDFTSTAIGVGHTQSALQFLDPASQPRTSANWIFDAEVPGGGSSYGLAFFSPNVPIESQASTIDGGSVGIALPVPAPSSFNIPEPSTLVLSIFGLMGLGCATLRRRCKV